MVSPTRRYGRPIFSATSGAVAGANYIAVNGTAVTDEGVKRTQDRINKHKLDSEMQQNLSSTQKKKLGLIPKKPARNPYKDM